LSLFTARAGGPSPTPRQVAPGVWLVTLGRGAAAANVYLVGSGSTWTLVDAGWASSAVAIRTAAEAVFGSGEPSAPSPDETASPGLLVSVRCRPRPG
jgi:hypothetical protein